MSNQLELYSIEALGTLQAALRRVGEEAQDGLSSAQGRIRRAAAWVREAVEMRRRRLEQAQREVAACESALIACQNSGFYDEFGYYHPPDCCYEEAALQQALLALAICEERLRLAYAWQGRLEDAIARYERETSALARLAEDGVAQACAELAGLARRYAAVHAGASARLGASSSAATGAPPRRSIDRGIRSVAISDLPEIGDLGGSEDFTKAPMNEMRTGLQRLQEMLPAIESGVGASGDYWAAYDQQRGLDYASGYQRVYDAFYGQEAIHVEKDGDRYDVINGRHRIWLARQMGISHLPMRVVERESLKRGP